MRVNVLELHLIRLILHLAVLICIGLLKHLFGIFLISSHDVSVVLILVVPAVGFGKLVVSRVQQYVALFAVHGDLEGKKKQFLLLVDVIHNLVEISASVGLRNSNPIDFKLLGAQILVKPFERWLLFLIFDFIHVEGTGFDQVGDKSHETWAEATLGQKR